MPVWQMRSKHLLARQCLSHSYDDDGGAQAVAVLVEHMRQPVLVCDDLVRVHAHGLHVVLVLVYFY